MAAAKDLKDEALAVTPQISGAISVADRLRAGTALVNTPMLRARNAPILQLGKGKNQQ